MQPTTAAAQGAAAPAATAQAGAPAAQSLPVDAGEPQILHLMVGRSLVITSPTRIKRISVADPAIADALVVSPYQVLVNGKAPGGVSLMLWDESDQSQAFEVSVDIDILSLSEKIHDVFPNEQVQIETSKDSVILSGHASSAAVADKIFEVVKNATPKVTSLISTPVDATRRDFAGSEIRRSGSVGGESVRSKHSQPAGREEYRNDFDPAVWPTGAKRRVDDGRNRIDGDEHLFFDYGYGGRIQPEQPAESFYFPAGH